MSLHVFKIFEKRKGINISVENVIAILLSALFLLLSYLKHQRNFEIESELLAITGILNVLYVVGLMISNFFRHKKTFGNYNGEVTFNKSYIQLRNHSYNLSEISRIDLSNTEDVKGIFI